MLRHMVYAFRMLWLPLDALDRLLRRSSRIVESKWAGCAAKLDSDLLGSPVQASDGDALCLNPRTPDNQSKEDLVITKKPVGDFEFSFEWKMSISGNGGIFYKVVEGDQYPKPWHRGLEMQLLDDGGHEEGLIDTHRAGDLYDMLSTGARLAKATGQWNQTRIVVKGKLIEQWMNGKKALSVTIGSAKWKRIVVKSKYSELSEFAKSKKRHIVLQDHGDKQRLRNLKIREF